MFLVPALFVVIVSWVVWPNPTLSFHGTRFLVRSALLSLGFTVGFNMSVVRSGSETLPRTLFL